MPQISALLPTTRGEDAAIDCQQRKQVTPSVNSIPDLQQLVRRFAQSCGFHLSGIAPVLEADTEGLGQDEKFARAVPELSYFPEWVAAGRGGEMGYLARRDDEGRLLRSSVRIPFPWARSVIVCAVNYNSDEPYSIDPAPEGTGWIARYAWSGTSRSEGADGSAEQAVQATDYHSVIRERLEGLREKLQGELGHFDARCFVDTGPLVERVYAKYAGIGWQGKNTCLIHEGLGSWLFLGVMLTSLELPPTEWVQPMADRCGSCTRCIDACPTDALEPYRMDAARCIAYLTIEKRGDVPEELAAKTGRHVFGCDICQEVCPWNNKGGGRPPVTDWPELQPREELVNPALDWLAGLGEEGFRRQFRHSPVERAKYAGWERNVAMARKNSAQ
jgi:epoxyqueuosine reductase